MSDELNATNERSAIQYMWRRLDRFVRGLGLDEVATYQNVDSVVEDMPEWSD
jgi:hypothetical protein